MKYSTRKITLLVILMASAMARNGYTNSWAAIKTQPPAREILLLRASNLDAPLLFTAEKGALFISSDEGATWKSGLKLHGSNTKIHDLKIFPQNPDEYFALTSEGLFAFNIKDKKWKQFYQGTNPKNKSVLSLAQNPTDPDLFYMGTERGVLISKDRGKSWVKAFAELGHQKIYDIEIDENHLEIYFLTGRGIYRYHTGQDSFRLVFNQTISVSESIDFEESDEPFEEGEENNLDISKLILTSHEHYGLVVAGKKQLFASDDEGETWEQVSRVGLDASAVVDLVYSELLKTFFIATEKSVFQFFPNERVWKELYDGLASAHIYSLAVSRGHSEKLFVATRHGIYFRELRPEPVRINALSLLGEPEEIAEINRKFLREPNIRDVQEAAIRYANVSNSKIKRWHYQSRARTLLPSLTFTKDLDISNNIHTDTGSTTTADTFVQGPDERDKSTDFDLTWDFGDLIFNSSQTSIDSREKLMVELRDEILAEVTRLYYERRRAELDFLVNPPTDPIDFVKAQMRIDELTANLDALTGGYFSSQVEKLGHNRGIN